MSDTFEETEEVVEETPSDPDIKALREAANRSKANAAAAEAAKRENAFLKAHVDTDSPLGKLAMQGYTGDLEPSQIQEFMQSLGNGTAGTVEESTIPESEQQSTSTRQAFSTGAGSPTNEPPPAESPTLKGLQEFQAARQGGATAEEASAYFFDNVFLAASKGDERVLITGTHNPA